MRLTIRKGAEHDKSVEVIGEDFVIGRSPACDLVLDDPEVSGRHASLRALEDGRAQLRDLDSSNGTYVNGHRVEGTLLLEGNEEIRLGETVLVSSVEPDTQQTVLARPHLSPDQPTIFRRQEVAIQPATRPSRRIATMAIAASAIAVIAIAVAVLALAGVFSSSDNGKSKPLTQAQFIDRGDRICRDANKANSKFDTEIKRINKSKRAPVPKLAAIASALRRQQKVLDVYVKRFDALPAPRGDEAQINKFKRLNAQGITLIGRYADVVQQGDQGAITSVGRKIDQVDRRSTKLARDYGFKVCSKSS